MIINNQPCTTVDEQKDKDLLPTTQSLLLPKNLHLRNERRKLYDTAIRSRPGGAVYRRNAGTASAQDISTRHQHLLQSPTTLDKQAQLISIPTTSKKPTEATTSHAEQQSPHTTNDRCASTMSTELKTTASQKPSVRQRLIRD
ncbi:hypothetical protein OS493_012589 [Desmophyllum pertusum]|uniref:Uncharacterized protein n=1 Tax=Desmophyllum pertusum TaxID=174260 RepID=A0A9W9ZEI9_9CNID|nr:hypothetical protein OS493_012589 [Desmophyllum pertusum]